MKSSVTLWDEQAAIKAWIAEHGGAENIRLPAAGTVAFAAIPVPRIVWRGRRLVYLRPRKETKP